MITLSEEQKEIVEYAPDRAIQVTASAGSGKTRVLAERVKHLLGNSKRGHVLALTFTNKAAEEMEARLGDNFEERTWISTIHSFAQSILEAYGHTIGLSSGFQIYERNEDRLEIFIQSLRDDGEDVDEYLSITDPKEKKNRQRIINEYMDCFSTLKREMIDNKKDAKAECPRFPHVWKAFKAYNIALYNSGGMDYEDILKYAYRILREQEWVASNYRVKYKHICVDEAQDLNKIQYEFIKEFCGKEVKSVMFVGDPDQMIYGFNGSSAKFMTEHFVNNFSPVCLKLTANYRSSRSVIDIANKLKPNSQTHTGLFPIEGEVKIHEFADEKEEANWVVSSIRSLIEQGIISDIEGEIKLESMVVIARNQFVFASLEQELVEAKIPFFLKKGSRRESPNSYFGKLIDYAIRLKLNERDWVHGSKLCKLLGIPEPSWGGDDLLIALGDSVNSISSDPKSSIWGSVIGLIHEMDAEVPKVLAFVKQVKKLCSNNLKVIGEDEAERVFTELDSLKKDWLRFCEKGLGSSLQAFRNAIALGQIDSNNKEGLMLSTVHTMKGLESNIVFLIGMVEGVFPDYRANKAERLEEELNSAFVAVTRSKRLLYITYPLMRMMPWGDEKRQNVSRFIKKMQDS